MNSLDYGKIRIDKKKYGNEITENEKTEIFQKDEFIKSEYTRLKTLQELQVKRLKD